MWVSEVNNKNNKYVEIRNESIHVIYNEQIQKPYALSSIIYETYVSLPF